MKKQNEALTKKRKALGGKKSTRSIRATRESARSEDYILSNFQIAPGFELAAALNERDARIDVGLFDLKASAPRIQPQDHTSYSEVYNIQVSPKELLLLSFELARVALLAYSRTSTIL
jgi:hypothetical protein